MGQVNDHSWKKTCLCHPKKKTGRIELSGAAHHTGKNSCQSPGNHDSRGPFSCAPALYDDGAGYLEQDIADEEHRYSQTVNAITESEIKIHFQGREGHIGTVQVGNQIKEEDERQQPPGDSSPCPCANVWNSWDHGHELRAVLQDCVRVYTCTPCGVVDLGLAAGATDRGRWGRRAWQVWWTALLW